MASQQHINHLATSSELLSVDPPEPRSRPGNAPEQTRPSRQQVLGASRTCCRSSGSGSGRLSCSQSGADQSTGTSVLFVMLVELPTMQSDSEFSSHLPSTRCVKVTSQCNVPAVTLNCFFFLHFFTYSLSQSWPCNIFFLLQAVTHSLLSPFSRAPVRLREVDVNRAAWRLHDGLARISNKIL